MMGRKKSCVDDADAQCTDVQAGQAMQAGGCESIPHTLGAVLQPRPAHL